MTDLRTAAQHALEYLDAPSSKLWPAGTQHRIITALRAALAQQDEPVQEPVAWMYTGIKQDGAEHGPHLVWKPEYMDAMSASKGAKATPLYTAPPQRKPLTQEEATALVQFVVSNSDRPIGMVAYGLLVVGAIERAHGIGGQE